MSADEMDPAIDELLSPPPFTPNAALKDTLWRQSSLRLRRRRRTRQLVKVTLLATFFLAGMGTMALLRPEPAATPEVVVSNTPEPRPQQPDPPPKADAPLSVAELELEAERTFVKTESARRFREAGDRYLSEEANIAAALRCYCNFLDEAGDDALAVAPSDTWLLTSLKTARRKEID